MPLKLKVASKMQVQKVLNPKVGGTATASMEEVVARLSRAKVGPKTSILLLMPIYNICRRECIILYFNLCL